MTERHKPVPGMTASTRIPAATLRMLYVTMLRIRKLEEKVADMLQPASEIICPVHLYAGQEAVAVGVCANLRDDDYVFSTHRSHGHYVAKGGDVKTLIAELYGRATGCSRGRGGSMHLASPKIGLPGSSAIVAGTIPIAVGAALAFSLQRQDRVSVAFFGDGAAGEGVLYESLNLASLKNLPVVFVCENNLYSTHMPIASCLANTAIYRKAEVFDIPAFRIDGNNVVEVYRTAKTAIEKAREGRGPCFIECLTYRSRGHVGPKYDVEKGLRSKEELDHWVGRDPIKLMEKVLMICGLLSTKEKAQLYLEVDEEMNEALEFARKSPCPDKAELMSNVFNRGGGG